MGAAVRWAALFAVALVLVFVWDESAPRSGPDVAVLEPPPVPVRPGDALRVAEGAPVRAPAAAAGLRDVTVSRPCTPVGDAVLGVDDDPTTSIVVRPDDERVRVAATLHEDAQLVAQRGAWDGRLVGGRVLALAPRNRLRGVLVDALGGAPVARATFTLQSRAGDSTRLLDVARTLETPDGRFDLGGWPISPSATDVRLRVASEGGASWTSAWIPSVGVSFARDLGLVVVGRPPRWTGRVVSTSSPGGVEGALVHVVPDEDAVLSRVGDAWRLPASWSTAPRALTDADGAFEIAVPADGRVRLVVLADRAPPWSSEVVDIVAAPSRVWDVELGAAGEAVVTVDASPEAAFVARLTRESGWLTVERARHVDVETPGVFSGLAPGVHVLDLSRALGPTRRERLEEVALDVAPGATRRHHWADFADEGRAVHGRVLGALQGDAVVALVDAETLGRVAATATVDAEGRFTFRTLATRAAFAMLYGETFDGAIAVGFAPVDLTVAGRLPTITFDPSATGLVVSTESASSAVALVARTGRPDLDRVAAAALARMPLRAGRLVVAGLPVGRYELRTADDGEPVVVDVTAGARAECVVP